MPTDYTPSVLASFIAGGFAGMAVDISLYPLDTIKSRLQSPQGFIQAGGFKNIYRGIQYVAVGSVPSAALFFLSYDYSKHYMLKSYENRGKKPDTFQKSLIHLTAASLGEIAACAVRVPVENMKLRNQTVTTSTFQSTIQSLCHDIQVERGVSTQQISNKISTRLLLPALYRGYLSTVGRDVPFAMIQFPIYEALKELAWSNSKAKLEKKHPEMSNKEIDTLAQPTTFEAALAGSISGSIAAAITTPLDVIKTRLMLGKDPNGVPYQGVRDIVSRVYAERGLSTLFAGLVPRVIWISAGGAVFLGAYDFMRKQLSL